MAYTIPTMMTDTWVVFLALGVAVITLFLIVATPALYEYRLRHRR